MAIVDAARNYEQSEAWIARLTVLWGAVAALLTGVLYRPVWGAGLMIGAMLAWLNFRWLKQGLDALTKMVAAEGTSGKGAVPVGTYFKAVFRYALIALCVYVIFEYLKVPVLSMVFGLCALGAATLTVSVHEIFRAQE